MRQFNLQKLQFLSPDSRNISSYIKLDYNTLKQLNNLHYSPVCYMIYSVGGKI